MDGVCRMGEVESIMKCSSEELGVRHNWLYRDSGRLTLVREKVTCTMCRALMNLTMEQNMMSPAVHLHSQIQGANAHYESWTMVASLVNCVWCRAAMNDRTPTHFGRVFDGPDSRGLLTMLQSVGYEFGVTYCRVTCTVCRYLFLSEKHKEARVTIQEQFKTLVRMFTMVENKAHQMHKEGKVLPIASVDLLCDAVKVTPAGRKLLDALIDQSIMVRKTEDGENLTAIFSVNEAENPDGTPLIDQAP